MNNAREDIIKQARELARYFDQDLANISVEHRGAFEGVADRELALAVNTIAVHGFADQETGREGDGDYYARVGPFVLNINTQGFRSLSVFDTETEAQRALEDLDSQDSEPERTIELVLRIRTNAHRDELDDFLGHASETLFSDRGGVFDERDGVEVRYEYEPTGSHWRDISLVRMYGEMHARLFHPAAGALPGGNELSPAEAVVQEQPNSTQRG